MREVELAQRALRELCVERPEGRSELAGRAEEHLWSIDEHVGFSVDCGLPAPCEERERLWVRRAALCDIF